ncbi:hypothetical protein Ato02nite_014020 [Paractinoplanes toevensis]|uniref:Uncharacterized protein n=1 Tax=Paractinoplanes toevensis TaxID=571911 RepID=A0A919T8E1_9ACTN|nr:hypothetical protein Ato02nite_014020 [Actinoplanes toevensis]
MQGRGVDVLGAGEVGGPAGIAVHDDARSFRWQGRQPRVAGGDDPPGGGEREGDTAAALASDLVGDLSARRAQVTGSTSRAITAVMRWPNCSAT